MEETRSIEQLQYNGRDEAGSPAGVAARFHQFVRVPVKDLSIEQIRLLLSQDVGTIFLLDKTLQLLETDILADGDFYPGDLLSAALNINRIYWDSKPELAARLSVLLGQKSSLIRDAGHKRLYKEVERFMAERFVAVG
ncbi:MAG: hypothetical protein DI535_23800 [Citrobacter freundii]|nr:MAG: hypothetical protein DI535_23800 [Citrobacter freundii]